MYDTGRTEDLSKYTVIDEAGNVLAAYRYKLKARHHADALNLGEEYTPEPDSYYESLG
jgi:hypothetical protein